VADAFDEAPFSPERQRTWPRVSVVVCAYNAADTLEDNLRSLEQLTYPDYEIILVNDGSKDRTSEIGHRFREGPRHRHAERGPERGAQRGLAEAPARSSPTPTPTRASIATG
jgi:Glycosyltransferases involved in cell wall biogenesis